MQLARHTGLHVVATAASSEATYLESIGAARVLDYKSTRFEDEVSAVDIVIDTVGGETRERPIKVLKSGGIFVSVVSPFPEASRAPGVRTAFFIVEVMTNRLNATTDLFNRRKLLTQVGTVLSLGQARTAHEMLAGAPHKRGKIVLNVATGSSSYHESDLH